MGIIPREVKLIALGVVVIAGALWFRSWLNNRDEAQSNKATVSQAQQTGQATVDIAGKTGKATTDRAAVETEVRTERIYIERQQEILRHENSNVGDWSNGVIPVELRDADRAARLARKRSSDNESGRSAANDSANN